ncbi:unnamed protein product [Clonostachys rosea f. rosea IK726]|uniref:Major facilitator superfamily (MFS) profile domain-containing protein n=2 Tax=Bionectria ochroleuca TaxID=29856 RepID=A0A0B7K2B4_BIOOC|nr:unnamed protein product [Clonostachys rosea f. rosea IK726]
MDTKETPHTAHHEEGATEGEQIEMIPGTEVMTDVEEKHLAHAHNTASSAILIPQPTNDPHDPLNWSLWWKTLVMVNQGFFVISSVIPALSIAPLTPLFMETWNRSLTDVALLTGVTVMLLGYCNFIIIPCSEIFGRRITLMCCCLLNMAALIWSATANSYGSFLGARILTGTGASANESIMNVVVADMYFLHERGKYVGSYFWCYFVGLFLGPVIAGAVADRVSYRWFFWACTIAQGVNMVALVFFFPETRRSYDDYNVHSQACQPSSNAIDQDEHKTENPTLGSPSALTIRDECVGKGRPSRAQFNLFQPIDRLALKHVIRHFLTPLQIFFFPIIFWASMSMGCAANALLAVNLLQSQALAAPPYNFTPAQVGYANFALVAGGIIGLGVAGPWSDWISQKATKRNGGIREPEMRLISLTPFIAAALVGLVAFGVGVQDKWPWPAVVVVGFGLVGVQVVAIPTIVITYAIDSYKPVTGEIMVIATVCKNTFGFGMTYFMNDWAASNGFIQPTMLLMAMTVGITLLGMVVFIFFGKKFRYWTKDARIHSF